MKRPIIDTLGGIWVLITIAFRARFRFSTPYWKWRRETAFGHFPVSRKDRLIAVLEYGKWVYRMRRITKNKQ